ncbi:hypothetical protein D3C86_1642560 [compost metagenome]
MKQLFLALFITVGSITAMAQKPIPGTDMPKAIFYKADGATFSTDKIAKGSKSLIILFDATCDQSSIKPIQKKQRVGRSQRISGFPR